MTKLHDQQHLTEDVARLAVPGGWLYDWDASGGGSIVYVPDPTAAHCLPENLVPLADGWRWEWNDYNGIMDLFDGDCEHPCGFVQEGGAFATVHEPKAPNNVDSDWPVATKRRDVVRAMRELARRRGALPHPTS